MTGIDPVREYLGVRQMKATAATTSVSHGTRNIPTVDTIFAVVNCVTDIGRLIRNGRVCFFLSLMTFDPGQHASEHDQSR